MATNAQQALLQGPVICQLSGGHDTADFAIDHNRHIFGNRRGDRDILFDQKDRNIAFFGQSNQQFFNLIHDDRGKPFRWFIQNQQAGVLQKGAGNRQHLLLPARQLSTAIALTFRQARERVVDTLNRPGTTAGVGQS